MLLWNLTEAEAAKRAMVLESTIDTLTLVFDGHTITAAASVGFAMIGAGDTTVDVLARADRAMYARKAIRRTIHEAATRESAPKNRAAQKTKTAGNRGAP